MRVAGVGALGFPHVSHRSTGFVQLSQVSFDSNSAWILRFDEISSGGNNFFLMRADPQSAAVAVMQRCYPQIYLACHVQHVRAASTAHRLSARDSSLLVHLSPTEPLSPSGLAAHMRISASTLSAAIRRLAALGYLKRELSASDRRAAALTLTPLGAKAMAATSVLDARRLRALLAKLTREERRRALEGMELLARASRQLTGG
jgi:DNA-binding MarR family transcriptional regulator